MSLASEALRNLPPPFANIAQLKGMFASKGLSVKDLVVLSGSDELYCSTSFINCLYMFVFFVSIKKLKLTRALSN